MSHERASAGAVALGTSRSYNYYTPRDGTDSIPCSPRLRCSQPSSPISKKLLRCPNPQAARVCGSKDASNVAPQFKFNFNLSRANQFPSTHSEYWVKRAEIVPELVQKSEADMDVSSWFSDHVLFSALTPALATLQLSEPCLDLSIEDLDLGDLEATKRARITKQPPDSPRSRAAIAYVGKDIESLVASIQCVTSRPDLEPVHSTPPEEASGQEVAASSSASSARGLPRPRWTAQEDAVILKSFAVGGRGWYELAGLLPGRTTASVRNRHLRLEKLGRGVLHGSPVHDAHELLGLPPLCAQPGATQRAE